jgi:hypothetical protein
MKKTMVTVTKPSMIKVFSTEDKANRFAAEKMGRVEVRYDYDAMMMRIVREYIVKF